MDNSAYIQVNLINVPRMAEDYLTLICFDAGASGVSETLAFQQGHLEPEPVVLESEVLTLSVFFESPPHPDFKDRVCAKFPMVEFDYKVEKNRDWLSEWKKGFVPFSLVEDFWIVPSWCPKPDEKMTPIFIDPGMAFGTGTHETTQITARLLYDVLVKNQET